jgi:hypothetical protein
MTITVPADLPHSYDDLVAAAPAGYEVSTRVMPPVLVILREGKRYYARPGARKVARGVARTIRATCMHCNWVEDDGTIYPLPRDVDKVITVALAGMDPERLTFPEILRLERNAREELPVCREIDVLVPANEEASREEDKSSIAGLQATLYGYQAQGVAWMSRMLDHTGGVILADEMGLGKTIQIIALFLLDPPQQEIPALIVCPTTLIENWVRELRSFAPTLSILVHRGSNRAGLHWDLQKAQLVITTYDTLANDHVIFGAIEWSFLVCDEAQAI